MIDAQKVKAHNNIEDVALGLYGITFDEKGRSRCYFPARHNNGDANPSLQIDRERQRIICRSQGCFGEKGVDVIGLVQEIDNIDFKAALEKLAGWAGLNDRSTTDASKPQIVATFDYLDEKGVPLFQVVRQEPGPKGGGKTFKIRQPDGAGDWTWTTKGMRWIPYRLPELLASSGPVVVVEGEKCVDALLFLGFTATTNPCGAGKWRAEFSPYLKGRDVLLWPDRDAVGRKHMHEVGRSLDGCASTIRIVEPPDELPDKGDVVDGMERLEWGRDQVQAILDTACTWVDDDEKDGDVGDGKKGSKDSQAVQLVRLALGEVELFHDATATPYARISVEGHTENWRTDSTAFRRWLARQFYAQTGKIPGSEAISGALSILDSNAFFEGEQHVLNVRVAKKDDLLWYDLADRDWRAVRFSREGWQIVDDPPILFLRYAHQQAQVVPIRGGDPHRLFEFLAVADQGTRLLLLVWLVATFIPDFPHPVPILHGPQGSGKSSAFRTLRRLIDPSATETLTFPRDINELIQKLSHHWAALFDNVAGLSPWQSDALCRAVTGEGFTKRQLYTNDDDVIYSFQRVIGLNGINVVATRPDLLDRSILIDLERIAEDQRRYEEEMETAFAAARPEILGGIFDALVVARRIKPTVKLDRLPRMADFCQWGAAIAEALGYSQQDFLAAYKGNLQQQNTEVLDGHPVAAAIMGLMEEPAEWEGEPAELLTALENVAEARKINTRSKTWPGAANALSRRIREVKVNLQEAGIFIEDRRTGRRRKVYLRRRENIVN